MTHKVCQWPENVTFSGRAVAQIVASEVERAVAAERRATAREVIERYNRAHGQNPKITLRQVCEEMGVNYASIRALKSRYAKQKRGKRKS